MFAEQIEKFVSATHTTDTNPSVYLTQPPSGITEGIWKVRDAHGAIIGDFAWSTDHKAWICPYDPPGNLVRGGVNTIRVRTVAATLDDIKMLGRDAGGVLDESSKALDAVGDAQGPFWEVDTDFDGRYCVAPGKMAGTEADTDIVPGTNYGMGGTLLTLEQLPKHAHISTAWKSAGAYTTFGQLLAKDNKYNDEHAYYADKDIVSITTTGGTAGNMPAAVSAWGVTYDAVDDLAGDDNVRKVKKLDMIPASRGVYMIKRTARKYLVATPV